MASIQMYIWRLFARLLPCYNFRNFCFRHVLENTIADRSSIHRGLEVYCVGGIKIGENTTINKYVDLDGRGGLLIGNRVSISPYVKILTGSHKPMSVNFQYIVKPVIIDDYVWIGTAAIILPGVTLGQGCIVAAGSVVSKSVAPYNIVAGNPAKKIGQRNADLDYSPFWRPPFQ